VRLIRSAPCSRVPHCGGGGRPLSALKPSALGEPDERSVNLVERDRGQICVGENLNLKGQESVAWSHSRDATNASTQR
jgi:hypothetical protein